MKKPKKDYLDKLKDARVYVKELPATKHKKEIMILLEDKIEYIEGMRKF